jgi:hypothetical protein
VIDYGKGLLLGILVGISGTKAYQTTQKDRLEFTRKQLVEKITDIGTMTCAEGVVTTAQYILDSKEYKPSDCKAIGQKWGDIYK